VGEHVRTSTNSMQHKLDDVSKRIEDVNKKLDGSLGELKDLLKKT